MNDSDDDDDDDDDVVVEKETSFVTTAYGERQPVNAFNYPDDRAGASNIIFTNVCTT